MNIANLIKLVDAGALVVYDYGSYLNLVRHDSREAHKFEVRLYDRWLFPKLVVEQVVLGSIRVPATRTELRALARACRTSKKRAEARVNLAKAHAGAETVTRVTTLVESLVAELPFKANPGGLARKALGLPE